MVDWLFLYNFFPCLLLSFFCLPFFNFFFCFTSHFVLCFYYSFFLFPLLSLYFLSFLSLQKSTISTDIDSKFFFFPPTHSPLTLFLTLLIFFPLLFTRLSIFLFLLFSPSFFSLIFSTFSPFFSSRKTQHQI